MDFEQNLPFTFAAAAWEAIQNIRQHKNIAPEYFLRVGIKGSGCAGEYLLGFDLPGEQDRVYLYQDLKICIRKAHWLYLLNIEIAYEEDEDGAWGFAFHKNQ
ncbi:MAG: iron-sulfur cluster assembly accessory protein [Microscillaceae bacterium]|jgi:iron-sulfur cluster assembly protein|nr:iron-sulfur cluster assembly accessory protein [Microscillaceae bacterium]